jgi:hypothetical protein
VDAFEYLSVLLSIVLGLGITQLLSGFGRWLEQRGTLRPYGPSIAWGALLLLLHVQTWWSSFGLRNWAEWNFLQFWIVLLQPIILFLLAVLVFPGPGVAERDLRANYYRQRPWFFGLVLALLVVSLAKDIVREGSLPEPMNVAFHGFFLASAGLALATEREIVQRLVAYSGLVVLTMYIFLLFGELA